MTNIKLSQDGNKLTLEIDLSEDHGPSASGKTRIISSTHGAHKLDTKNGEVSINLNVYKKN